MGRYIGVMRSHPNQEFPASIDEGTTVVIKSGMNFVISRVVPSIIPEIRYDVDVDIETISAILVYLVLI